MFRQAIALDIGSRSTKIAVKNKKHIPSEPRGI